MEKCKVRIRGFVMNCEGDPAVVREAVNQVVQILYSAFSEPTEPEPAAVEAPKPRRRKRVEPPRE